jgi:hypothetical protein
MENEISGSHGGKHEDDGLIINDIAPCSLIEVDRHFSTSQ